MPGNPAVLIATALEESGAPTLEAGLELARALRWPIHLVHAWSPPPTYAGITDLAPQVSQEVLQQERTERLAELERRIEAFDIADEELQGVTLEMGPAHRAIVQVALRIQPALLVLGANESGGRLAWALGSTADRVLRKASCPVLVARGRIRLPLRRVLAPVDLSELSAEAFNCGLSFLDRLGGAEGPEVEALHVVTEIGLASLPASLSESDLLAAAERELQHFVHRTGRQVARKVRFGRVSREILVEMADWEPDLVIMGTHGAGGFERLLLGSVASTVVRNAPCSVLVVPPGTAAARTPSAAAAG